MKKAKKVLAVLCTAALAASMAAGCGTKETMNSGDMDQAVTLTAYDANVTTSFGNDDVSKEITKQTGVTLDYAQASGDAKEKLNLMLASNTYPDLLVIARSTGLIDQFIAAKALIPLEELIEEYGPNIKEQYGEYLNRAKSEDGHIYGLPNWYGIETEPVLGFMIRKDFLAEVAPKEVVEGERPMTQSEFLSYLKAFKEKHPTVDGKQSIPFTMLAETWGSAIGTFKGMFGIKTYGEKDGKIVFDFNDPRYKDMLSYINEISRNGLMDKEWVTNKKALWQQKLASGAVFATVEAYWNTAEATSILSEENPDAMFLPYKVVADGVDAGKTTYASRNPMGWDIVGITSTNPHPERTIKFLDYLASDEGQILLMSGVEGNHYVKEDGKRVIKPEALAELEQDASSYFKKTGVRYWTICVKNGNAKDGLPYLLYNAYSNDPVKTFAYKTLSDTIWDCSPYEDLNPVGGTTEALNYKKINDTALESCTKIINASSREEFESLWTEFIEATEKLGSENVEKIFNENYQKKMKLWGMEP